MDNSNIAKTMNHLMNGELKAAHLYWQAGGWCVERHLDGCARLLLNHADEELTHMRKMLGYLIDREFPIVFEALPAPTINADNILDVFKAILAHENLVTEGIDSAVREAQAAADHSTFEFLQWFIKEQREEVKTFQNIIDRIKLIGDGPQSLYFIDQEVAKIAAAMAAASQAAPASPGAPPTSSGSLV